MKTTDHMMTVRTPLYVGACLAIFLALSSDPALGQGKLVDKRDQAEGWYLPIHGQVFVEGKRSDEYQITVYKDNEEQGQTVVDKQGRFELQLDIDQAFTVRISKPGYQDKLILVETTLPQDLVSYPDYEMYVDLRPLNGTQVDPFYTDFPSAIVRYNPDMGGFYHSEAYMTHIQTKLTGFASATF